MSNTSKTIKPQILYNKPPIVQLASSSSSEMPSCTIANAFIPPSGVIPENHMEEPQTEKLGYWGYRHLYPFGYGGYGGYRHFGYHGYPYLRYGCYGYPCYRGGIYGYPWY